MDTLFIVTGYFLILLAAILLWSQNRVLRRRIEQVNRHIQVPSKHQAAIHTEIFDHAPSPTCIISPKGAVTYSNQAFRHAFTTSPIRSLADLAEYFGATPEALLEPTHDCTHFSATYSCHCWPLQVGSVEAGYVLWIENTSTHHRPTEYVYTLEKELVDLASLAHQKEIQNEAFRCFTYLHEQHAPLRRSHPRHQVDLVKLWRKIHTLLYREVQRSKLHLVETFPHHLAITTSSQDLQEGLLNLFSSLAAIQPKAHIRVHAKSGDGKACLSITLPEWYVKNTANLFHIHHSATSPHLLPQLQLILAREFLAKVDATIEVTSVVHGGTEFLITFASDVVG